MNPWASSLPRLLIPIDVGEHLSAEDLQIQDGLVIPGRELTVQASLSGGAGGQHVNKTCTRITLRWHLESSQALSVSQRDYLRGRIANRLTNAGDVVVHCDIHRQQNGTWRGHVSSCRN